jgi:hypothetical protein
MKPGAISSGARVEAADYLPLSGAASLTASWPKRSSTALGGLESIEVSLRFSTELARDLIDLASSLCGT